jgi:hypothetical protein
MVIQRTNLYTMYNTAPYWYTHTGAEKRCDALVQFVSNEQAKAAWGSPKAVMNNRFIKYVNQYHTSIQYQ